MPKKGPISGRKLYTAEELLKKPEYKIDGKLKREIDRIEEQYEMEHDKDKLGKKTIKFNHILTELKKLDDIELEEMADYHKVKHQGKVKCWVAERTYGVALMTWEKNGKNFKTEKLRKKEEIKKVIEVVTG